MVSRSSTNPAAEVEAFLAAHPDVSGVELLLPDLNGILRGKRISRREVAGLYRKGMAFPGTGILLDSRGALIDTLAAGSRDGDPDHLIRPVPGTLVPVPWSKRPLGQCLVTMSTREGRPYFADGRQVLKGIVAQFKELGLTPVVAVEYEFYLLDDTANPRPRTGRVPGTSQQPAGPRVYSLEDLHALDDFFAEVADAAAAQGIPAGGIVSEYGAGQFEVNLHHVSDAVAACDHAILLRRLIRGIAPRHGLAATFMAKPFADLDGSGMHVHVSLLNEEGNNAFGPDAKSSAAWSERLPHAIGGMLAALPESLAIFAPNANSYRRIRPGCYAPIAPNWGPNHRQVALRIPLADAENQRFEHRVAGADCNPYLAIASILAAAHHGITTRLEPPPMVAERSAVPDQVTLHPRWEQALDAFDAGTILPAYLGGDFCRVYSAARRFEADAYHAEVPAQDYEWYLGCV